MRSTTIEESSMIFKLFVQEYRKLEPTIAIHPDVHDALNKIIDQIVAGEEVDLFKSNDNFKIEPFNSMQITGSKRCSDRLASFFETLAEQMHEQQTFAVSAERAVELLYNFDCDDGEFSQDLMTLNQDGGYFLSSTKKLTRAAGNKISMWFEPRDAYDWTLF